MSIHEALLAFASEFTGAHKTGVNPHFKSQHFTLDDVVRATAPILAKNDLFVSHYTESDDTRTYLTTAIFHKDGETLVSKTPMQLNGNPQAAGSMITYYKRYNLCALLNISEADDDGNAAAAAAPKPASLETLAALRLIAEDEGTSEERAKWINGRIESGLTEERAQGILNKLRKEAA